MGVEKTSWFSILPTTVGPQKCNILFHFEIWVILHNSRLPSLEIPRLELENPRYLGIPTIINMKIFFEPKITLLEDPLKVIHFKI